MVVEEEETMGDKGEEGWLLIPALVWLTSIIDRSTDGHNNLEGPLPTCHVMLVCLLIHEFFFNPHPTFRNPQSQEEWE